MDWGSCVRHLFKDYFRRQIENKVLSGEVEIDASLLERRLKYHRGNPTVGVKVWVLGLVERTTNSRILYPVNDRTEETLLSIIEKHAEKGSTIYNDGWSAYCDLNSRGYKNVTVLHKYTFKKICVNV